MDDEIRKYLKRCERHVNEQCELENSPHHGKQYVAAVREHFGVGVREFARMTRLSPSYISKLENGKVSPSIAFNARLAKVLKENT